MDINEIYEKFLNEVQSSVSKNAYSCWFSNTKPISFIDDTFTIQVPVTISRIHLQNNYQDIIDQAFINVIGKTVNINFLTEDELQDLKKDDQLPENIINDDSWQTNLNLNLNFDNFVVGDSNKFAFVSARNVAENPGLLHNPLFIYGRSGIGKTHLMHAIGNYITQNSNKRVLYITSSDFVSDYSGIAFAEKGIDSISYAKKFKEKYQNVDVLLIDDIQFLVGADKSQQEFFNTFNALFNAKKQIIISSDRSPDDLKKIEERLRSRFSCGLTVDIYPPDFNLRCKIIKSKIKGTMLEEKLNEETIEYIANACQTDVRFIEGTLNRLMAYTAMMVPKKVDLNFTIEALKDNNNVYTYNENNISKIMNEVAKFYNITVEDLKSKRKTANIAYPRHIAIYLSRLITEESLERIGLEFGGRDHSTISASYDKITEEIKNNSELKKIVETIKNKL